MTRKRGLGIKVALITAIVIGGAFAVCGGLVHGYTWFNLGLLSSWGFLIGAMAGPELEPKAFRFPTLWQVTTCALGCMAGAIYFQAPLEGIALAALIGVVLGYLAPYWLKHITFP